MSPRRFFLRQIAFTGQGKSTVSLDFASGLTVIWGGSQAGKTFVVKALDYMFGGGTPLPRLTEAAGYDRCWLEMHLPKSGRVTLARSMSKGPYDLFRGGFKDAIRNKKERTLADSHSASTESLSGFLLRELEIDKTEIARTQNGEKSAFTIRHFARYLFTEETRIIAEESPSVISHQSSDTFN